jgi:hypothetical protein
VLLISFFSLHFFRFFVCTLSLDLRYLRRFLLVARRRVTLGSIFISLRFARFIWPGRLVVVGPSQLFAARDAVYSDSDVLVWRKLASCLFRRRRRAIDWDFCVVACSRGPRRFAEDRRRSGEDKLSYFFCVCCCCQWLVLSGLSRFIAGGTFAARLIALLRWPLRASWRC